MELGAFLLELPFVKRLWLALVPSFEKLECTAVESQPFLVAVAQKLERRAQKLSSSTRLGQRLQCTAPYVASQMSLTPECRSHFQFTSSLVGGRLETTVLGARAGFDSYSKVPGWDEKSAGQQVEQQVCTADTKHNVHSCDSQCHLLDSHTASGNIGL